MSSIDTRIAGIDYGRRRIGVALTDGLGITAQPLVQLLVTSFKDAVAQVADAIRENDIDLVVIGLPRNMDGSEGEMANEVREFSNALTEACGAACTLFDERLTSMQADTALREMNLSRKKKKAKKDIIAAQLLLQAYLDSRGFHG